MKLLRRIVRVLDSGEDIALLIVFIIMFLIGFYSLYDTYLVYKDATDTSILKYKPDYEGEAPDKEIVGNMVAWISVDDTSIDYPIMQGETNEEYLNKNPFGEYSLSGSIFLDSRNSPDFKDEYSLVYGHHMEQGLMFGALDKFLNEEYFESHTKGELYVCDDKFSIQFFAVVETDATNEYVFSPTEVDAEETLKYIENHAVVYDSTEISGGKRLIALSTCKYPDTAERTIVFGYF